MKDFKSALLEATPFHFIIIILLVSFAVYFNSLSNGFVYDDTVQVVENGWIKDIRYIPKIFSTSVVGFLGSGISNTYRPMTHLIYMFDYHIFGLDPWGYHLMNILVHGGVSVLVFIITLGLCREFQPSASQPLYFTPFVASILFVTHPVHTEAVAWVAGALELFYTFCYLLSFHLYMRSRRKGSTTDYIGSLVFFFIACISKEQALTLPVIIMIYDAFVARTNKRPADYVKRYIPYFLIAGVYFLLRVNALGNFVPLQKHGELSAYLYVINVFPLFMQYLEKLLLPINLNAFYVFHPVRSLLEAKSVLSLAVTGVFIALAFITVRKKREAFFSLSLIVVPLLPVLYIPGLGQNTFTERYLYLPSVGFTVLAALSLSLLGERVLRGFKPVFAAMLIITGLYSAGTVSRNPVWKDDYSLFADTVKKSPDAPETHQYFGYALQVRGRLDEAIEQYKTALRLKPAYAEAHNNMGQAFFSKGLTDKAIEQYQTALSISPGLADAHNNLGVAFFAKGWLDKAMQEYQVALRINPYFADAHNNLGEVFIQIGLTDEAVEHFLSALRLQPGFSKARYNLGMAYRGKEQIDATKEHLK